MHPNAEEGFFKILAAVLKTGITQFADLINLRLTSGAFFFMAAMDFFNQRYSTPIQCYSPGETADVAEYIRRACYINPDNFYLKDGASIANLTAPRFATGDTHLYVFCIFTLMAVSYIVPYAVFLCGIWIFSDVDPQEIVDFAMGQIKSAPTGSTEDVIAAQRLVGRKIAAFIRKVFRMYEFKTRSCCSSSNVSLTIWYMFFKVFYACLSIFQIAILGHYFGNGNQQFLLMILNGSTWRETGLFIREMICSRPVRNTNGNINNITSECLLTNNYFNEKLVIGIWFWLAFLSLFNICAVLYHGFQLLNPAKKRATIEHYLLDASAKPGTIERFCRSLPCDFFLILMFLSTRFGRPDIEMLVLSMFEAFNGHEVLKTDYYDLQCPTMLVGVKRSQPLQQLYRCILQFRQQELRAVLQAKADGCQPDKVTNDDVPQNRPWRRFRGKTAASSSAIPMD